MPDGLRGLPTPEEDEQKKWLYFAIPGKGSKDPYSGQYLRLYSGIGQAEKSHIPEAASPLLTPAATAASELKSATMSAKGVYILKADQRLKETFGHALTEVVRQGDHHKQVEEGSWKLVSEQGEMKIKASATDTNGKVTLTSSNSNIVVKAQEGSATISQKEKVSEQEGHYFNHILGAELSWTNGKKTSKCHGLSFSFSAIFDISTYVSAAVSGVAVDLNIHGKVTIFNIWSVRCFYFNRNAYMINSKRSFVYNEITIAKVSQNINEAMNSQLSLTYSSSKMKQRIAEARSVALDQGWAGMRVFNT